MNSFIPSDWRFIPVRDKVPIWPDWPSRGMPHFEPDPGYGIGLVLGPASGGNGGHGRNGYRSKPASGSVGKNIDDHSPALLQTPAGQPASPQAAVDERRQSVNNPPAFVPRTV